MSTIPASAELFVARRLSVSSAVAILEVLAFLLSLLILLIATAATLMAGQEIFTLVTILLSVTATISHPLWALTAFSALLPWFGNRPGTTQSYFFLIVLSGIVVGLTVRRLLVRTPSEALPPSIYLGGLYVMVAIGSLVSATAYQGVQGVWATFPSIVSLRGLVFGLDGAFRVTENSPVYLLLSVTLTLLSFGVAVGIYRLRHRFPAAPYVLGAGLGGGLLCSIGVGIADYYQFIDLRWLRSLDPVVNIGNQQFRLQSTFGHSGWYAEYLTLTVSFFLLLLGLNIRYGVRVFLLIALLLVGEFVLLLTFQRGGWLAYPLSLFVIWGAIYVFQKLERGEANLGVALRSSVVKVLVSFPLTILCSLGLLLLLQRSGVVSPERQEELSAYTDRFKAISNTGDRTEFFVAGLKLGLLNPWFGAGSESFAVQFNREFNLPNGAYYQQANLPLHGSAHNVYMQTFSGKGLAGLLLLLLILGVLVVVPFGRVLRDDLLSTRSRLILLSIGCFGVAFLIYGNVQEVFYVASLQALFFIVIGMLAAVLPSVRIPIFWRRGIVGILVALFLLHLCWQFLTPGRFWEVLARSEPIGCSPVEARPDGVAYQWCGPRGELELPVENGRSVGEVVLPLGQEVEQNFLLHNVVEGSSQVRISFHTSEYFVPSVVIKDSDDRRVLSFQVLR
jgi:O-antigen ligase